MHVVVAPHVWPFRRRVQRELASCHVSTTYSVQPSVGKQLLGPAKQLNAVSVKRCMYFTIHSHVCSTVPAAIVHWITCVTRTRVLKVRCVHRHCTCSQGNWQACTCTCGGGARARARVLVQPPRATQHDSHSRGTRVHCELPRH